MDYNAALASYKDLVNKIKKATKTLTGAQQNVAVLGSQTKKLQETEIWPREERLEKIRAWLNEGKQAGFVVYYFMNKKERTTAWARMSPTTQQQCIDAVNQKTVDTFLHQASLRFNEYTAKRDGLANEGKRIKTELEALNRQWDDLTDQINNAELPIEALYDPLLMLYEDVFELVEGYKNRGAPSDRRSRATELRDAISSVLDFISEGKALPESVKPHFAPKPKGFPAIIRLK